MAALAATLAAPALRAQSTASAASTAPAPAPVGTQAAAFPHGLWELMFENDWFYGTDRDLTNDLRFGYTTPNQTDWAAVPVIPNALGHFFDRASFMDDKTAVVAASYYAQQNIYTPNNLRLNPPDAYDRPYAGWVGLGIDLVRQTATRRAVFEINPGWVGPESGAQQLQQGWHSTIGATYPQGWGYQIRNEPVIQLTYRQDWRPDLFSNLSSSDTLGHDVILHGVVTAGNGWDYLGVGFLARAGYHVPNDYGPARERLGEVDTLPYAPGGTPDCANSWSLESFSAYVCVGGEERFVAHDITLDGNTFANSRGVGNEPTVGEAYGGLVVEYAGIRASFLSTYETRTFRAQVQDGQWRGIATLGYAY